MRALQKENEKNALTVLEHDRVDSHRLTLRCHPSVIQIPEVTAETLVEDCVSPESEGAVVADGEAGCVDGA